MTELKFNGKTYTIEPDDKSGRSVLKCGEEFLGTYAAFHGAVDAAASHAYPSEAGRSLRTRP